MKIIQVNTSVALKISFNWNSLNVSNGATAVIGDGESPTECAKSLFQKFRKLTELEANVWYETIHKDIKSLKEK